MAQPIAQHPPSALQFPSASRTSALGFGFASPGARSPFAPVGGNINFGTAFGGPNAFASSSNAQTGFPAKPGKVRPPLPSFHSVPRTQKRSRTSISPSPPRRNSGGSSPSSPSASPTRVKEILAVNDLRLSSNRQRTTKRLRHAPTEPHSNTTDDDLDLGLMLATLPPSTHLQILNSLIAREPSLRAKVLDVIPTPDLQLCNDELYRTMERISRQYGEPGPGRHLLSWTRAEVDIAAFSRTALTYLSFFYSRENTASIGVSTQHNLLYTTTKYAGTLVRLLPPQVPQSAATSTLSQLVNTLISRWREWVESVSRNVNEKGEIYPLSSVSTWAANLAELADPSRAAAAPNQACPDPGPAAEFAATMSGIRELFLRQVGWLIGPRPDSTL